VLEIKGEKDRVTALREHMGWRINPMDHIVGPVEDQPRLA
jgi:hypothetical protein